MSGYEPTAPRLAPSRVERGSSAIATALLVAVIVAASLTTMFFVIIGG